MYNMKMENQQLQSLSNEQIQVLLTGKFGDGCLTTPKNENSNSNYSTNCIHREYLEFKKGLLGNLAYNIRYTEHNGFKQSPIYSFTTVKLPVMTIIKNMSLESGLELMDDLGLAMWIYDDGSLHKHKYFYNINTQAFSKEIQEDLFVPFFNKWNIYPKVTIERKKDGREFHYLRVSKHEGSYEIATILNKHRVDCYSYKIWSSETIQKWSKVQENLKSTNSIVSHLMMTKLVDRAVL